MFMPILFVVTDVFHIAPTEADRSACIVLTAFDRVSLRASTFVLLVVAYDRYTYAHSAAMEIVSLRKVYCYC